MGLLAQTYFTIRYASVINRFLCKFYREPVKFQLIYNRHNFYWRNILQALVVSHKSFYVKYIFINDTAVNDPVSLVLLTVMKRNYILK